MFPVPEPRLTPFLLSSLPASGTLRSCSPTSRTATASQGTCWSAFPQVRSQAGQWPQLSRRTLPTPCSALPGMLARDEPLAQGLGSSMPPALITAWSPQAANPRGMAVSPYPDGVEMFPTPEEQSHHPPPPPRCSSFPQWVTVNRPSERSPSSHRLLHPRHP